MVKTAVSGLSGDPNVKFDVGQEIKKGNTKQADSSLSQKYNAKQVEGVSGAKGVGSPVKIEGRGSTGRIQPNNLNEQMAMHEVQSNPLQGATELPITMSDSRWPASEGWVKMQKVVTTSDGCKITIHFDYNKIQGLFDDFKFI